MMDLCVPFNTVLYGSLDTADSDSNVHQIGFVHFLMLFELFSLLFEISAQNTPLTFLVQPVMFHFRHRHLLAGKELSLRFQGCF